MKYPKRITATIAVGDKTSNAVELLDFDAGCIEIPAVSKTFGLNVSNVAPTADSTMYPFFNYHDATATKWAVASAVTPISVDIPTSALANRYIQLATDTTAVTAVTAYINVGII